MAKTTKIKFKSDVEVPNIKVTGELKDSEDSVYPNETRVQELIDEALDKIVRAEESKY